MFDPIRSLATLVLAGWTATAALAQPAMQETPYFADAVSGGTLPPVAERIPQEPLVADLKDTISNFKDFSAKAGSTLDQVDKLVAAVDTEKVGQVVNDVSAATAKARGAIDSFADVGNSVSARKQDIDDAITDFTQLANKLNNSSNRVDSILKKVDDLLGSDDTKSLSVEARKTLTSIREVADNLNKQIGPIAANFAKFSNTGLRNVEQLVNDTRATVRNLNNTISNFDADPQRLLFGGETVKQYDGRTRR